MSDDQPERKRRRTEAGSALRNLEKYLANNQLDELNHTGPTRTAIRPLEESYDVPPNQFRDAPQPSPELVEGSNAGRHEVLSTANRNHLKGNPIAVAVSAAARTSTALTFLKGENNTVTAHSGLIRSGKSTKGQAAAHTIFHDLPQKMSSIDDPYEASALAMQTALDGFSRARFIRDDDTITGSTTTMSDIKIEKPDPARGYDDGYESDTERGRITRRFATAERHLKNSLNTLRKQHPEARKRTRAPSPPPILGGRGYTSFSDLKLPDVSNEEPASAASLLTNIAFSGFQTIRRQGKKRPRSE